MTNFNYQSALVGFDGNNRKYPSNLNKKLRGAGFVEHTLAKEGPDELRFICHRSVDFKLLSHHKASGFESMHHIQVVKFRYNHQTIGAVFFNSGRGDKAETERALRKLAEEANELHKTCDYVVVLVVEFGEGDKDKTFEFHTLSALLRKEFTAHCGTHRECIFVSRNSGGLENDYFSFPHTSVAHQSPTRGDAVVVVERLKLMVSAWHSQAGAYNGSRPHKVKQALIDGWWVVYRGTNRVLNRWLLHKKI